MPEQSNHISRLENQYVETETSPEVLTSLNRFLVLQEKAYENLAYYDSKDTIAFLVPLYPLYKQEIIQFMLVEHDLKVLVPFPKFADDDFFQAFNVMLKREIGKIFFSVKLDEVVAYRVFSALKVMIHHDPVTAREIVEEALEKNCPDLDLKIESHRLLKQEVLAIVGSKELTTDEYHQVLQKPRFLRFDEIYVICDNLYKQDDPKMCNLVNTSLSEVVQNKDLSRYAIAAVIALKLQYDEPLDISPDDTSLIHVFRLAIEKVFSNNPSILNRDDVYKFAKRHEMSVLTPLLREATKIEVTIPNRYYELLINCFETALEENTSLQELEDIISQTREVGATTLALRPDLREKYLYTVPALVGKDLDDFFIYQSAMLLEPLFKDNFEALPTLISTYGWDAELVELFTQKLVQTMLVDTDRDVVALLDGYAETAEDFDKWFLGSLKYEPVLQAVSSRDDLFEYVLRFLERKQHLTDENLTRLFSVLEEKMCSDPELMNTITEKVTKAQVLYRNTNIAAATAYLPLLFKDEEAYKDLFSQVNILKDATIDRLRSMEKYFSYDAFDSIFVGRQIQVFRFVESGCPNLDAYFAQYISDFGIEQLRHYLQDRYKVLLQLKKQYGETIPEKNIVSFLFKYNFLEGQEIVQFFSDNFSNERVVTLLFDEKSEERKNLESFLDTGGTPDLLPAYPLFIEQVASAHQVESQDRNEPVEISESQTRHETRIAELETKLGLSTPEARLLEASLCIQSDLLITSCVTHQENVAAERLYGDEYWEQWLQARLYMKQRIDEPLSLDLILGLASIFSKDDYYSTSNVRSRVGIGVDNSEPYTLSQEIIDRVEAGGYITFVPFKKQPAQVKHTQSLQGVLLFPSVLYTNLEAMYSIIANAGLSDDTVNHIKDKQQQFFDRYNDGSRALTTASLNEKMLSELVDWYNTAVSSGEYESYDLSAELQRRYIQIHPQEDKNGRASRALMAWSQEKLGGSPGMLHDEEDFFTKDSDRAEQLRKSSIAYSAAKDVIGGTNAALFDKNEIMLATLTHLDRAGFGAYLQSQHESTLMLLKSLFFEQPMNEQKQRVLNDILQKYRLSYLEFLRKKVGVYNVGLTHEYPFLIDEETQDSYVDMPTHNARTKTEEIIGYSSVPELSKQLFSGNYASYFQTSTEHREAIRTLFCSEKMAFKGCLMPKRAIGDQDYLRLFLQPVGITSSYLTSNESSVPSDSLWPVSQKAILQSFDFYNNQIVDGLKQSSSNQKATGELNAHINWNETKKSAVTSLTRSIRVAWAYANRWLGDRLSHTGEQHDFLKGVYGIDGTKRHMGIVLESQLPREGFYYTANADTEILVPGALIPESLKTVYIYLQLSEEPSVLDANSEQVVRNNSRYLDDNGKRQFPHGDPSPITLPSEIYSRHVHEGTEYVVHMTGLNDLVSYTVFALTDSRFSQVSNDKADHITHVLKKELDETLEKIGKKAA